MTMVTAFLFTLLLMATSVSSKRSSEQDFDDRPRILVEGGNLVLVPARDKNVTFRANGRASAFLVGETNVLEAVGEIHTYARMFKSLQANLALVEDSVPKLEALLGNRSEILRALQNYDGPAIENTTDVGDPTNRRVKRLRRRITAVEGRLSAVESRLGANECASNPCKNGATCIDGYQRFHCICDSGWQGDDCSTDFNECQAYEGTVHACWNGGTCTNLPGTFTCACPPGWYGLHCHISSLKCSAATNAETCGHGTCLQQADGIQCMCELGWKTNGVTPACTVDVDECSGNYHPCSTMPLVPCINTPGSFKCGSCPIGYSGNGFYCTDIDECQVNNGGCSTNPSVPCHNTIGSRICGKCPPGYEGDGITCTFKGLCEINNGGCHPLATCATNSAIGPSYVQCMCPAGFTGSGFGPRGCSAAGAFVFPSGLPPSHSAIHCDPNPCLHGACHDRPDGYVCICEPRYTGTNCDQLRDPCLPQPCKNGGTCIGDSATMGYRCECTAGFRGTNCQRAVNACGGRRSMAEGNITYPEAETALYNHNSRCAWVIETSPDKVLNVRFSRFNLENSTDCLYDWLQIHDGRNSAAHLIGRFCGNAMPRGGTIVSTHNALYLWFRSDRSVAHRGFSLRWTSADPQCGGQTHVARLEHGILKSPGAPGRYPPNRDCYWRLTAIPGKRLQFHFYTLQIETHDDCDHDYLAIHDGVEEDSIPLARFCNSSHPPPLTTTSNEALVHFHSDNKSSDYGFQISYASVEGLPGCGGFFTRYNGEISAPTVGGKYGNGLECDYLISLQGDVRVKLNFLSFDVEGMDRCHFDKLLVYDGNSSTAPLLGRFCGTELPPDIISASNQLFVVFKSDWSLSGTGFRIKYEIVCHEVFTANSGVVTSPGYPKSYPPDITCTYLIQLAPRKSITLEFEDFSIEGISFPRCIYDSLKIYDGDTSDSPLLGQFCSYMKPENVVSQFNALFMEFRSDTSVTGGGFKINYNSTDLECGGIYKENNGTIRFPTLGDDEEYENEVKCEWMIVPPAGMGVQFIWEAFDLEATSGCFGDYLEVYEQGAFNRTMKTLGRYCGDSAPPSFTSLGTVRLVFNSDESIRADGFTVTYRMLNLTNMCGGRHLSQSGVVSSPGYPGGYLASTDCTWEISVPRGHQIKLNVSYFDTETTESCNGTYLEIFAGVHVNASQIGKYCGDKLPPVISTFSNSLKLHFHSNAPRAQGGFLASFESVSTECGGVLEGTSGTIMSPNYPDVYDDDSECYWKIIGSEGSLIEMIFTDLQFEEAPLCNFDFVEIMNEDAFGMKTTIGKYCDSQDTNKIIHSLSNHVYVRLSTDAFTTDRGFSLNYKSVCNTNIYGDSGVIESFNFPREYPPNANCSWTIHVPRGNKINITFSHFELANFRQINNVNGSIFEMQSALRANAGEKDCADFVQILDSSERTGDVKNKFCGSDIPPRYTSLSNVTSVHFQTDSVYQLSGFRLEWIVFGCGGRLARPEGSLDVSGVSSSRGIVANVRCDWLIRVDEGRSVELLVERYAVADEADQSDRQSLEIFSGTSERGVGVATLRRAKASRTRLTSAGNYMFVRLSAGDAGLYFVASYTATKSKCGGVFTSHTATIHSPNYPNNYPQNSTCYWYITVMENHRAELRFNEFDMSVSNDSCLSYVKIYDGLAPNNDSLIKTLCSNWQHYALNINYNGTITSSSNKMLIEFSSQDQISAKGFSATYSTSCGSRIVTESEGLLNPNPLLWAKDNNVSQCQWTIVGSNPGDRVSLTFTHMDLYNEPTKNGTTCPKQYVQVFNGESPSARPIGMYCGTKIPATIVGGGNALTILLSTITEPGQLFSAFYSVLSTSCGGHLTSEEGSFTSPHYPKTYPMKSDCVWFLAPSLGNRISLTFTMFNVGTDNCEQDYLEIREDSSVGKLLGVFCGNSLPSSITSSTTLWIKFHSDDDGTGPGFIAEYNFVHGNEIKDLNSGTIESPLYPNPFTAVGQFHWRITVRFGDLIRISIKNLMIGLDDELCMSNIKIFDGYDDKSLLMKKICGTTPPESMESTSNMVYIEFNSFRTSAGSLFALDWRSVKKADTLGEKLNNTCGANYTISLVPESRFKFASPGYPEGYAPMLNCTWNFETDPSSHLQLKFDTLSVEEADTCILDKVTAYTGTPESDALEKIGDYCLANATLEEIRSKNNLMSVVFQSDISMNRSGFEAEVFSVCGSEMTQPSAVLSGPTRKESIFLNFFRRVECEWKVQVRAGRTIKVKFLEFAFNNTNNCDDYIMLRNGISDESPILGDGKYCGDTMPTNELETSSNHLYVKYVFQRTVTNMLKTAEFKLQYTEKSSNCGGDIILNEDVNSTEISSPNYPNIPNSHTECAWRLRAPAGERIRIDFVERFDLTTATDCPEEFVEVRDGGTEYSNLLGKYCSTAIPSTVKSTGNLVYIKFLTDVTDPKNGFKLKASIDVCGGSIYGESGFISSPTQLQALSKRWDIECEWKIVVPETHFALIQMEGFIAESQDCAGASVQLFNYSPTNETENELSNKLCSKIESLTYNSANNIVLVKMMAVKNSFKESENHFRLTFNSSWIVCGGEMTTSHGVLEAFPSRPTSVLRTCRWRIVVEEGRKVTLKLLQGYESSPTSSNILHVFSGDEYHPVSVSNDTVESSSNVMVVNLLIKKTQQYVQFKAQYTSLKQSDCGRQTLEGEGWIVPPTSDVDSYSCRYSYAFPQDENPDKTLVMTVSNLHFNVSSIFTRQLCSPRMSRITILGDTVSEAFRIFQVCKSEDKPLIFRSPFQLTNIEITKIKTQILNFRIDYKTNPCGGVVNQLNNSFVDLKLPENYEGQLDCSWLVKIPEENGPIKIFLDNVNLTDNDCKEESFLIRNYNYGFNNVLQDWCENKKEPLTANVREFAFEYHSARFYNTTSLKLKIESTQPGKCGRNLYVSQSFNTPNYPKNYDNNQECIWQIHARTGNRIKLFFKTRFAIEQSNNCKKDFVQIIDINEGKSIPQAKICGRNLPENFTSTSNRLNVLFRSDSSITNDGFEAQWENTCGGTYWASEEVKTIKSPGFRRNVECSYIIRVPEGKNLMMNFTKFSLAPKIGGLCKHENLSIQPYYDNEYFDRSATNYCGTKPPEKMIIKSGVKIIYKSSGWFFRPGFELSYGFDECGGVINKSQNIHFKAKEGSFMCTWNITSPEDKIISLRFSKLRITSDFNCQMNSLKSFEGDSINENKTIVSYCGDMNKNPPTIKSTTNKMIVNLNLYFIYEYNELSAEVLFLKACNQMVHVNATKKYQFEVKGPYEEFLDCHWLVKAPADNVLRFKIASFHVAPCTKVNQTALRRDNCSCDFLEIRDGNGPHSDLIGKYCGDESPNEIVSTSNGLWIRFVSDGTVTSSGIAGEISTEPSVCGTSNLKANKTMQMLMPPLDAQGYVLQGIRCTWTLEPEYKNVRVKFINVDLTPPIDNICKTDYLEFTNEAYMVTQSTNNNSQTIAARHNFPDIFQDDFPEYFRYMLCGQIQNSYVYLHAMQVRFTLTTSNLVKTKHKGFKIEYGVTECSENFTMDSGRIMVRLNEFENATCLNVIKIDGRKTISLYFRKISTFNVNSTMTIRDGDSASSPILGKIVGASGSALRPLPFFSTGNAMRVDVSLGKYDWIQYEATYMASANGRGCGGSIHDHRGIIYSPLYPLPYRDAATPCEWNVETPANTYVVIKFTEFDLGPSTDCKADYVELRNRNNQNITKYCPQDEPGAYTAPSNYVKIVQHASENNGGTGWVLVFKTKHYFDERLDPED